MVNPGVGGRGKRAPYETVHYRIPKPVKPVVERLSQAYRQLVVGEIHSGDQQLLRRVEDAINSGCPGGLLEELRGQVLLLHTELDKVKASRQQALQILNMALKLKPNAGGAIKREIEKALLYLTDNPKIT